MAMTDDGLLVPKPRPAISVDQVQSIVRRAIPEASVLGITELHGGEMSTVLEISPVDAPACIVKAYPASLQWKMAKEVYVLGLLRDVGIAVPRIHLADDTRSVIDLNYLLMTRLDGAVLGQREAALSDAELFAIYAEMGAALRRINDVILDSFGYIGPNGVWTACPSNHAYMSAQLDRKLLEFCTRGGDPVLAARLRDHRSAGQRGSPNLGESLQTPFRQGRHAPFPFSPLPFSASSVMCSTDTTCSSSAVSNTITPWVERPAMRMPSTGQRISWPLSVTSMI
jgi:hypothetical protein